MTDDNRETSTMYKKEININPTFLWSGELSSTVNTEWRWVWQSKAQEVKHLATHW